MIDIQVDTDLSSIESYLLSMIARADDLGVPFAAIGDEIIEEIDRNFEAERSPSGVAWRDLKPATIEEKTRLGYPLTKLQRERVMKNSFDTRVGPLEMDVTTDDDPGKVLAHDGGTTRAGRGRNVTIPQREFVPSTLTDDQCRRIANHVMPSQ